MSVDWESKYKEANAELANVRREAAGYRTGNKGQLAEAVRELAAMAGIDPDAGDRPDVQTVRQTLQTQREKLVAENRDLRIKASLHEVLHRHGVKNFALTKALLADSGALSRLDVNSADFDEALDTAVGEALEENPELKGRMGGATAGRSGPDFTTSGVRNDQISREELAGMSNEDIVRARAAGKLDSILGRRK